MSNNPNTPRRRSIRLHSYDYSQNGAYFVTICTQQRECLFGDIDKDTMRANAAGQMLERWWSELANKFLNIELDSHIVMPNHFHGIVVIVGADLRVSLINGAPLPEIVQWFKTMTTNEYIRNVKQNSWPSFQGKLWQRNYYEHVIRSETSLNTIRQYIETNPARWAEDQENPSNIR